MAPRLARASLIAMALAACSSCGAPDEVVARVGDPDAGDGSPRACTDSTQCGPGEVCKKTSCNAAQNGVCQPLPEAGTCTNSLPVCGCDGLEYWNDCLRQVHGVAQTTAQSCAGLPNAITCNGPDQCPPGTYCGLGVLSCSNTRGQPAEGICWVLPDSCPTNSSVPGFNFNFVAVNCAAGGCTDVCKAIKAEEPFAFALSCP